MKVWVVESGEYEQSGIDLVAASVDAAVTAIKGRYSSPEYQVTWALHEHAGFWTLTGVYQAVAGSSTTHKTDFDISPFEVTE